jgi:heme-degrading monooxygenase HmoA
MAVGMLMLGPGLDASFYDSVMEHLEWETKPKPQGFVSHYAGPTSDGFMVFDIWDSQADFERFAQERLTSALAAAGGGQPPDVQPQFIPIHNEDHA